MRIFVDQRVTPLADWQIIGAGNAFVPRKQFGLLVRGIVYEIQHGCVGDTVNVMLSDGSLTDAVYVR